MPLIGINSNSESKTPKRSMLEQIAMGVDMASKVLGTGVDAYKVFGVELPKARAEADYHRAQAAALPGKTAADIEDRAIRNDNLKAQTSYYSQERPVELAVKKAGLEKAQSDLAKVNNEKQFGKQLSENTTQELSQAASLPTELQHLNEIIAKNTDLFGPVAGRVNSINQYDSRTQTVKSQLKTSAQTIGKYLEGGKMTDSDIARYQEMLPSLNDLPESAQNKVGLVSERLINKFRNEYQNLKKSGYDTRAFEVNDFAKIALPDYVAPSQGAIDSAISSASAPKVPKAGDVEDNHRFLGGNPADPKNWEVIK